MNSINFFLTKFAQCILSGSEQTPVAIYIAQPRN